MASQHLTQQLLHRRPLLYLPGSLPSLPVSTVPPPTQYNVVPDSPAANASVGRVTRGDVILKVGDVNVLDADYDEVILAIHVCYSSPPPLDLYRLCSFGLPTPLFLTRQVWLNTLSPLC